MAYFSYFYNVEVRDEIVKEFTDCAGNVDDMMAGLHEVRAKLSKEDSWLKELNEELQKIKEEEKIIG